MTTVQDAGRLGRAKLQRTKPTWWWADIGRKGGVETARRGSDWFRELSRRGVAARKAKRRLQWELEHPGERVDWIGQ